MKVIDHEESLWFLFEYEGQLYLDVICTMSFIGYNWMILLNQQESASYLSEGREYLNKLAYDIQYSTPIAKESNSIYIGRDVSKAFSALTLEAVNIWRAEAELLKLKSGAK